jgi:integrase
MPVIKLNKRIIDELPFETDRPKYYRDTELPGFGVRVGAKRKSYFVEASVNKRNVRHTLGSCAHIQVERARQLAKAKLGEMAEGKDLNLERKIKRAESITLRAAFDEFFKYNALSLTSEPNYKRSVDFHLADWAKKPIAAITRDMILQRHRKITSDSGGATANNVMRHLSSVWNFTSATTAELPTNPTRVLSDARAWTPPRRRRDMIPHHQFKVWFAAVMVEPEMSRDFLLVALFTGMRCGEIKTLRWEHVDFAARTLTAPKTKNGHPLVLPLSGFLHNLLTLRREADPKGEWVFPGPGRTGHLVSPKRFITRVNKVAKVEKLTLHGLRRTFATIANSVGVSELAIKSLLNHRTDNDITGGYIVASADDYRAPAERIAARILELAYGRQTEAEQRKDVAA